MAKLSAKRKKSGAIAPIPVPKLEVWEDASALPVQSVLEQFSIDKPVPFSVLMQAYQNEDRKLALRLEASHTLEQIAGCFQIVPCGSLNHFGKPTLSEEELERLAKIIAEFLREAMTVEDIQNFQLLPKTLKDRAWVLLTPADKKILKAIASSSGGGH